MNRIHPGDKIDIKYIHQNNGRTFKSAVYDIFDDGKFEISIPTESGKLILFQNGTVLQFYFYAKGGIYTCEVEIKDRYKRGNFPLFLAEIKTPLKKYQRREYFRFNCLIDFTYYKISESVANLKTTRELLIEVSKDEYIGEERLARTKDLSGGGMQFIVSEPIEIGTKLLVSLPLSNDKVDRTFDLVTEVVKCFPVENLKDRWIVRGKFHYKNIRERELVVQYVFEEDRMLRKKENG